MPNGLIYTKQNINWTFLGIHLIKIQSIKSHLCLPCRGCLQQSMNYRNQSNREKTFHPTLGLLKYVQNPTHSIRTQNTKTMIDYVSTIALGECPRKPHPIDSNDTFANQSTTKTLTCANSHLAKRLSAYQMRIGRPKQSWYTCSYHIANISFTFHHCTTVISLILKLAKLMRW